jgi:hypothetical protein
MDLLGTASGFLMSFDGLKTCGARSHQGPDSASGLGRWVQKVTGVFMDLLCLIRVMIC